MTDAPATSPTQQWTHLSPLEALDGPEATAEALILLLHYGIDWDNSWVSRRLADYWGKRLPSRIIARTHTCQWNLRRWWQETAADLEAHPRNRHEREELTGHLQAPPRPVLLALRNEAEFLVMRAQIITTAVREAKGPR